MDAIGRSARFQQSRVRGQFTRQHTRVEIRALTAEATQGVCGGIPSRAIF